MYHVIKRSKVHCTYGQQKLFIIMNHPAKWKMRYYILYFSHRTSYTYFEPILDKTALENKIPHSQKSFGTQAITGTTVDGIQKNTAPF